MSGGEYIDSLLKDFHMYQDRYMRQDECGFVLYEKYYRKDVCRLLNWDRDMSSVMYGKVLRFVVFMSQ